MTLKRKLSDISSSPSTSSTSSVHSQRESPSPSPCRYAFDFHVRSPVSQPNTSFFTYDGGYDFGTSGRTRKRYRDNRPDEATVHATTFQKLFMGQRQQSFLSGSALGQSHLPPDAMDTSGPTALPQPAPQQQPRSQSSLHRFFQISSAPSSNVMPMVSEGALRDSWQCEDCDRPLGLDLIQDDVVMADEGFRDDHNAHEMNCHRCGRTVCDLCAVSNLSRECLQCWRR